MGEKNTDSRWRMNNIAIVGQRSRMLINPKRGQRMRILPGSKQPLACGFNIEISGGSSTDMLTFDNGKFACFVSHSISSYRVMSTVG